MQTGSAAHLRGKQEDQSISVPRQDTISTNGEEGRNLTAHGFFSCLSLHAARKQQQIDRLWPMQLDGVIRACHSCIFGLQTKGPSQTHLSMTPCRLAQWRRPLFPTSWCEPAPKTELLHPSNGSTPRIHRSVTGNTQIDRWCPGRLTAFDGGGCLLQTGSRHGTFRRMQPRYVPGDKHLVGSWFRPIL